MIHPNWKSKLHFCTKLKSILLHKIMATLNYPCSVSTAQCDCFSGGHFADPVMVTIIKNGVYIEPGAPIGWSCMATFGGIS